MTACTTVQFFGPEDLSKGLAAVRKLGFKVLDRPDDQRLLIVESQKPAASREAQFEPALGRARRPADSGAQHQAAQQRRVGGADGRGGRAGARSRVVREGETICVCDTGLDTGDPATIHPDFKGRVAAIKSFPITPDFSRC